MTAATPVPGGFALYVHWPFCESKCPYCDFNSHVADDVDTATWQASLLSELDRFGNQTKGRRLDSVFFGGGTPSLMPPETVAAILAAVSTWWTVAPDLEVTLEANPSSVEARKFADFSAAGVNRASIGVQSFDDGALRFLGRAHGPADADKAISLAKRYFDRVSFDLIYALPGQSRADWARQLDRALAFDTGHLSLYQLTIEKGTPFYAAHKKGDFQMPDDDLAAELYEFTGEIADKAGLDAYEVSNYAQKGQESSHNLVYWRGGEYVGIGPGAHGRVRIGGALYRTEQIPLPANWLAASRGGGGATRVREVVSEPEHIVERLIMGMRLADGLDRALFRDITGAELAKSIADERLAALETAGLVVNDARGLRATPAGRQRLNAVIEALVP